MNSTAWGAAIVGIILLIVFVQHMLSESVVVRRDCNSPNRPKNSKCTGCPPRHNGKLCASTTRYTDCTRAACGLGPLDDGPADRCQKNWTFTSFTAAMNAKSLSQTDARQAWCPKDSKCGKCFRLCTTGGAINGKSSKAGECKVFKITNRCGDGFDDNTPYWCSQKMSYAECEAEPSKCVQSGNTNDHGYSAHFDLMDLNNQITELGWDNPEVTFEEVDCSEFHHKTNDGIGVNACL